MRDVFQKIIGAKLSTISSEYIDLNSGQIHREVGGYPGNNHRMPVCCEVMYKNMKGTDYVLSAPPKGNGASLNIRYFKINH